MGSVSDALVSDVSEMERISRRFFAQCEYSDDKGYVYDTGHIKAAITSFIQGSNSLVRKYEEVGKILGYMVVTIPAWCHLDSQPNTAFEMVWHGDPKLGPFKEGKIMLALIDDMVEQLKGRVKGFQISASQPSVLKALERRGFRFSTTVMHRRL